MEHVEAGRVLARAGIAKAEAEDREFLRLLDSAPVVPLRYKGILVCEGDTWFDYHPPNNKEVLKWLEKRHGFEVREAGPQYGDTLREMSDNPRQLRKVRDCLAELHEEGSRPRALLLSAGGNDIATKEDLAALLNHKQSGLPRLEEPRQTSSSTVECLRRKIHNR